MTKTFRLAVDTGETQLHQDLLTRVNERMDVWMRDGRQLYQIGNLTRADWEHDLCRLLLAQMAISVVYHDIPLPALMRELAGFTRQIREQIECDD